MVVEVVDDADRRVSLRICAVLQAELPLQVVGEGLRGTEICLDWRQVVVNRPAATAGTGRPSFVGLNDFVEKSILCGFLFVPNNRVEKKPRCRMLHVHFCLAALCSKGACSIMGRGASCLTDRLTTQLSLSLKILPA